MEAAEALTRELDLRIETRGEFRHPHVRIRSNDQGELSPFDYAILALADALALPKSEPVPESKLRAVYDAAKRLANSLIDKTGPPGFEQSTYPGSIGSHGIDLLVELERALALPESAQAEFDAFGEALEPDEIESVAVRLDEPTSGIYVAGSPESMHRKHGSPNGWTYSCGACAWSETRPGVLQSFSDNCPKCGSWKIGASPIGTSGPTLADCAAHGREETVRPLRWMATELDAKPVDRRVVPRADGSADIEEVMADGTVRRVGYVPAPEPPAPQWTSTPPTEHRTHLCTRGGSVFTVDLDERGRWVGCCFEETSESMVRDGYRWWTGDLPAVPIDLPKDA